MRDLRVRDLIIGTMKSAKSANLILKGFLLDQQGKKVLTFAPEMNTRDGEFITSRALPHMKRPAIVVPTESNGNMIATKIWVEKPDVILIDELQFFTVEQVERLAEISITYDVDIYAYGLMMSYNGKMFEPIRRAIECAFRIQTIDMSCDHCINDATHHLYYVDDELVTDGSGIAVEDEEFKKKFHRYESVCFSCYNRALDVAEMKRMEKEASNNIIWHGLPDSEGLMFPKEIRWGDLVDMAENGIDLSNSDTISYSHIVKLDKDKK